MQLTAKRCSVPMSCRCCCPCPVGFFKGFVVTPRVCQFLASHKVTILELYSKYFTVTLKCLTLTCTTSRCLLNAARSHSRKDCRLPLPSAAAPPASLQVDHRAGGRFDSHSVCCRSFLPESTLEMRRSPLAAGPPAPFKVHHRAERQIDSRRGHPRPLWHGVHPVVLRCACAHCQMTCQ